MSIKLPTGRLTAGDIIVRLAQPMADEDGFVDTDDLVASMKGEEGDDVFPPELRGDQVGQWVWLKGRYSLHPVARLVEGRVELLADLVDENMLAKLYQRLTGPEQEYLLLRTSNRDRFRFYWKVLEIYRNGGLPGDGIEGLRAWARRRISGWPHV